jgi:hypothetical protein
VALVTVTTGALVTGCLDTPGVGVAQMVTVVALQAAALVTKQSETRCVNAREDDSPDADTSGVLSTEAKVAAGPVESPLRDNNACVSKAALSTIGALAACNMGDWCCEDLRLPLRGRRMAEEERLLRDTGQTKDHHRNGTNRYSSC